MVEMAPSVVETITCFVAAGAGHSVVQRNCIIITHSQLS